MGREMGEGFDIKNYLPDGKKVGTVLSGKLENLPSLPVVALKLLKLTGDLESPADQLVKVVETDPSITAKVLKTVNAAAYGFGRKISSVQHAIVLLGFEKIRTLSLEISLYDQFLSVQQTSRFDYTFFWQHCLSVASLSRAIAEVKGHPNPEDVYVAGLLHDLGKMLLESHGKISYGDFLEHNDYSCERLVTEEYQFIGLPHDQLGAFFCERWGLSDSLVLPVRFHHESYRFLGLDQERMLEIAIVSLANYLTWAQGIGSVDMKYHQSLQLETMELVPVEELDIANLLARMDREVQETAEFYNITFPSLEQLRGNLLLFNMDLCKLNSEYVYRQVEMEDKLKVLSSLKDIITSPYGSLNRREIINHTLSALHKEYHYDRLYLLEVQEKTRVFKISYFMNFCDKGDELTGLEIQITPMLEGFIDCLRSKVPKVIDGRTSDEARVLEQLGVREFGIVPIVSDDRVTGLIGVDNVVSEREIVRADLSAITLVAHELGKALEHAALFYRYRVMASIDGLTGLYNRSAISEKIKHHFLKARSTGEPLTLAMVDIDYFKNFNDNYGHIAGDMVLKILARTMRKFSRPKDFLGRYGGEEFMTILPETGFEDGFHYGERLRKEVEKLGRLLYKRYPAQKLTVSVGVASFEAVLNKSEELIAKADNHLYMAKKMGRNKVVGIHEGEKKWAGGKNAVAREVNDEKERTEVERDL